MIPLIRGIQKRQVHRDRKQITGASGGGWGDLTGYRDQSLCLKQGKNFGNRQVGPLNSPLKNGYNGKFCYIDVITIKKSVPIIFTGTTSQPFLRCPSSAPSHAVLALVFFFCHCSFYHIVCPEKFLRGPEFYMWILEFQNWDKFRGYFF